MVNFNPFIEGYVQENISENWVNQFVIIQSLFALPVPYSGIMFDGWMKQHYTGIRFERYADDIIIHASREQIAQSILQKLEVRFTQCGLSIHPTKTKIVCLTRNANTHNIATVHSFESDSYGWAAFRLHKNG